jgi:hypothetical protein
MNEEPRYTLDEAEEILAPNRRALFLEVNPDRSSANLYNEDDLYITKADWLEIRRMVDAFWEYQENSPDSIYLSSVEEINERRIEIHVEELRRRAKEEGTIP